MKLRKGFTLAELLIAMLVFAFMLATIGAVYATATRHMYQNYRQTFVKSNALIAMNTILHNLSMATRIYYPLFNDDGIDLLFAVNVDQTTGCYPINPDTPSTWHYFCAIGTELYYHTDDIALPAGSCASSAPPTWAPGPLPVCDASPGVLLLEHLDPDWTWTLFSRRSSGGVNEIDTVGVNLTVFWDADAAGFGATGRDVAHSLKTVVKINRPRGP